MQGNRGLRSLAEAASLAEPYPLHPLPDIISDYVVSSYYGTDQGIRGGITLVIQDGGKVTILFDRKGMVATRQPMTDFIRGLAEGEGPFIQINQTTWLAPGTVSGNDPRPVLLIIEPGVVGLYRPYLVTEELLDSLWTIAEKIGL
jgi:hypothetical protein